MDNYGKRVNGSAEGVSYVFSCLSCGTTGKSAMFRISRSAGGLLNAKLKTEGFRFPNVTLNYTRCAFGLFCLFFNFFISAWKKIYMLVW